MVRSRRDRICFNVGGELFETTATTIANAGRDSMLGAMLDDDWNLRAVPGAGDDDFYFIDRNPACFGAVLDLLRTGALHLPANLPEKLFYREALYYGVLDHVRSARWGRPLDGNLLQLAASVPGRAAGDGTAIRAATDGGCCVAHGSVVHVYNWMLEQRRPLSLDHQQVNDVGYINDGAIVVTGRERLGKAGGGMALFSAADGDLRHRFRVSHGGQVKSFTAGALAFNVTDSKILASCKGRLNEFGVGVWDWNTGELADFFYGPPGSSVGDADKLQWLDGENCLMVATLFPRTDNCLLHLVDFRQRRFVWEWSDAGTVVGHGDKRVLHAVALDDDGHRSICVINKYDDLGFIDIRGGGGVRWRSRSRLMKRTVQRSMESCYPKLATHGGQLFTSMNDSISVFSGPEFALTATLRNSSGGSICDFSIGGDRLFALHSEDNIFDVWEAPPAPAF